MKTSVKSLLSLATLAIVASTGIGQAKAQENRSGLPLRTERVESSGPNRQLLRSGTWTLGVSYVPALAVAIKSERHGDDYLYYPVVGPWLDLSHRGECSTCRNETLNQGLLVADGLFQGLGALQIVGAFLLPERHTVETVRVAPKAKAPSLAQDGIRIRFRPVRLSSGYGLQATAKF